MLRSAARFRTDLGWVSSRYCFSFGQHYDPLNTHFGRLMASNEEVVAAGAGFDTHPHRDVEIVTWVLSGSLVHQDSQGHNGVIYPGLAQRMSAGRGILHSEKNDSWRLSGSAEHHEPVQFIQMWLQPESTGIDPSYEQRDVNKQLDTGELIVVASGLTADADTAAIRIAQSQAGLLVGRLAPGRLVELPNAPQLHIVVARGEISLETGEQLGIGDSARLTNLGGLSLTAGKLGAEVLIWKMY